jgi:hydroxypyruvate reductase/gluconate 2-dehydrogenase
MEEIDKVLPLADHVVMATPGIADADHILDERRFALMKPTATVVNIGRGN